MRSHFDEPTRLRLIQGLRAGLSVAESCQEAGIARSTFGDWMRKGARRADIAKDSEYARFRREVDAIRMGREAEPLSDTDLVRLLEVQARRGSVRAIHILLTRRAEQREGDTERDSFDAIEDELAARRGLAE